MLFVTDFRVLCLLITYDISFDILYSKSYVLLYPTSTDLTNDISYGTHIHNDYLNMLSNS